MAPEFLETLLQSAAAYRFRNKHRRHAERAKNAGEEQALFENLAETLGYHANKTAMRHLALRAQFELAPDRSFPWTYSGNRPANHPQRRVGALAVIAADFDAFKRLCLAGHTEELTKYLSSLTHPYWSTHVTLPSPPSPRPMALMGRDRILDFIINHLLPMKDDEHAWKHYLSLRAGQAGTKVLSVHQSLLGGRPDAHAFLAKAWHHQELLQIHEDLCSLHSCAICSLLRQMEKK